MKSKYLDGDIIFHEGEPCTNELKLLSGSISFFVGVNDDKISHELSEIGTIFGDLQASNKFSAKAKGEVIIQVLDRPAKNRLDNLDHKTAPSKQGASVIAIKKNNLISIPFNTKFNEKRTYSNPGLISRLLNGLGNHDNRISIRVAPLIGDKDESYTRQIIAALGNDQYIQTKYMQDKISIDFNDNTNMQLTQLYNRIRGPLAHQRANVLVWGYIPTPGNMIYLRFVPVTMWDQQAPGAFNLDTEIALPSDFGTEHFDLLRFVTTSAAIQLPARRNSLLIKALQYYMDNASKGLTKNAELFDEYARAATNNSYASALCSASLPGYNHQILSLALDHFRISLSLLDQNKLSIEYGYIQKNIGSILHIEADRSNNSKLFEQSADALIESLRYLSVDQHPYAWGIIQNRLGLILYRQGLELGNTSLLRKSIDFYKEALNIYNRQTSSFRWAEIMSNFAQALQVLGEHTQSLEALKTSANTCLLILEIRNEKTTPAAWAATQNNLGSALFLLGKRTRSIKRLKKAKIAFEKCLKVNQTIKAEKLALTAISNLKRTNDMLTNLEWEQTILNESPRDPSALPEPGEGLVKKNTYASLSPIRYVG